MARARGHRDPPVFESGLGDTQVETNHTSPRSSRARDPATVIVERLASGVGVEIAVGLWGKWCNLPVRVR